MNLKLGALTSAATDVTAPARMVVIDADTQRPLTDAKGNECYIDFLSIDSEVGRALDRARSQAAFRKMRSGRNTTENEDPVETQVETLTALAKDWFFGEDADKFSPEAAKELFSTPEYAWLRKQAYVFVHAEANFIKRSSKT